MKILSYFLPILGYLLGSISSAIVVAWLFGLRDPREVGSGNPGATNVLRYGGRFAAMLTLAGDVLKGAGAVLIARLFTDDPAIIALTAAAAFLGHLFPVFFGFRGGKGVATALGVWLALHPLVGLALALTWLATAGLFRYSSLSALVAAAAAPVYVWWLASAPAYLALMIAMSVVLIFRHRANIRNLIAGREGKIGART